MSGRLSEVEERIAATHQLDAVIAAMRGIAASRARDARERLGGIRASATTVGAAIGDVLAFAPASGASASAAAAPAGDARRAGLVVVVGSEQGFVGAFNEQIAEHASQRPDASACQWLLVGARLTNAVAATGVQGAWSASMVAHVDEVPRLATRVVEALYARLDGAGSTRVSVVHALPGANHLEIVERTLVPFDFRRFDVKPRALPPLVNLPPARLMEGLVESYVYVELCEALMLSFAAENEARVRAMLAARTNVQQRLDGFTQQYRAIRQDEITSEIVELTAGAQAMARRWE